MQFYDTKFEAKPKKPEYKVHQLNTPPFIIYHKPQKENTNLSVYMQNLDFMKEQTKLFNYVDRTKKFLPEDDNYFRF
jgi:hypothetical protein